MADKMLIDATHPEETRVVVLRGNRVEEFDFESANRKQLRGNIYLAKVTRVEPSLQAAFVDYGGNRHGFLAFSEIHPDYYQIPVADRQALLAQEERDQRAAEADDDRRAGRRGGRGRHRGAEHSRARDVMQSEPLPGEEQPHVGASPGEAALGGLPPEQPIETETPTSAPAPAEREAQAEAQDEAREAYESPMGDIETDIAPPPAETASAEPAPDQAPLPEGGEDHAEPGNHLGVADEAATELAPAGAEASPAGEPAAENGNGDDHHEDESVESVGGADAMEEVQERLPRFRRQYKIQEVIKRRQVMLVQVVKEERGTKGAALTTYLSLAGRYSVLMPNTARGGGISRKITSGEDRSRLKEIAQELEVPQGMGVILRTAGASRTKAEVKRDFEYLLRLWETVRDLTLKSVAPKLVYEEGSLTKRSIRDLYTKDIDEIIVSGEEGYKEARDFMRMLMPSHVKNVKLYKDNQPLFTRYGIESQLDAMFSPTVQLRSGGYIVINQAEALVAIDVNSGRATREHHIEDTALKTNGEAAEEIARQLRLRDLAGLIVIDFIDMDESRNNRTVERRLKEALKHDRARIQVGRISHFGLLEMSRQRIRTSVLESSTEKCPVCGGSGHVRSVSSVSLQLLRAIEETLIKGATHNLIVRTRPEVALYVLNHKRAHLRDLEERFRITITISADATVTAQVPYAVDRGEQVHTAEAAKALAAAAQPPLTSMIETEEEPFEAEAEAGLEAEGETPEAEEEAPELMQGEPAGEAPHGEPRDGGRRRRRRGRGRGRGRGEPREGAPQFVHETMPEHAIAHEDHDGGSPEEIGIGEHPPELGGAPGGEGGEQRRRRRRGRRGGRRNRQGRTGEAPFQGNGGGYEPELHAGTDFPPVSDEDASAIAPPFHEGSGAATPPPEPAAAPPAPPEPMPAAPQAAAPAESEPPRRRSTIREPAPIGIAGSAPPPAAPPVPPPTPVVSSTASEEPSQPKRGWWAKRLLGDK
ncbi:MAG TPA: Rne/Rng family ribonuclease [Pseudolabrys sp.]|nr:Rne/Rng family ribonuclease [Pseudolabrys sp.]